MTNFDEQEEFFDERFQRIDLRGRRFVEKRFEDCIFERCDAQETQFISCYFGGCRFIDCDMSQLTLRGTRFSNVYFERCKLMGINWTDVAWSKFVADAPISFDGCSLDYGTFLGLRLHNVRMSDCSAQEVDFREAALVGADLTGTEFAGTLFQRTNLQAANLVGAKQFAIDPRHNDLTAARFALPDALLLLEMLGIELVD